MLLYELKNKNPRDNMFFFISLELLVVIIFILVSYKIGKSKSIICDSTNDFKYVFAPKLVHNEFQHYRVYKVSVGCGVYEELYDFRFLNKEEAEDFVKELNKKA